MSLQYKSFENTVRKVIACDKQFLFLPVFFTSFENFLPFSSNLKLLSAKSFTLKESKICCLGKSYPFPKHQILDSFKQKEFADDNFEFDEHDSKFSKQVENTVGKGEIARYEQFLIFSSVFKRLVLQTPGLVWERVNEMILISTYKICLGMKSSEIIQLFAF